MDKIKVLFLAANPSGTSPLKLDEEIREITQKIALSEYRDMLELISVWAVRPDDLLQSFNQHKPHIVHFSGHGSQAGEIILLDDRGSPKTVNTKALKALFKTLKDNIQVVLLNACYSRLQAEAITEIIDCAIGMNIEVGDQAAITFAASFYRAVGFGRSVKEAFEQGLTALELEDIPEENTPELLLREGVDAARIFLIKEPGTAPSPAAPVVETPPKTAVPDEKVLPPENEAVGFETGMSINYVKEILQKLPDDKKKRNYLILHAARTLLDIKPSKRDSISLALAQENLFSLIDFGEEMNERFEAGEILGGLGDQRIGFDKMVQVEAGEFLRGSHTHHSREKPQKSIYLDAFMIGKYPVTNKEFAEFIAADGYQCRDYWTEDGWLWKENERINLPLYWCNIKWNGANFPVVGISWYEASAYTAWLSRKTGEQYRLPSEAEWEKAARGVNGLDYPWGNSFAKELCNSAETGLQRSSPVGVFPGGKSSYGCMDMAGNVWEWCRDWHADGYLPESFVKNPTGPSYGSYRVVRGGSWHNSEDECRASYRRGYRSTYRLEYFGFRLAKSIP